MNNWIQDMNKCTGPSVQEMDRERDLTDKINLADLRRTMTLWNNRVTALGFDGVSDLIDLAEAGSEQIKKAWPIDERVELQLMYIKQIGEGSTTANSLPHVARIADEALRIIRTHRTGFRADQKVTWRLLQRGEPIQAGDEGLQDDCLTWLPIVGWEVGMQYAPAVLVPMRRRLAI